MKKPVLILGAAPRMTTPIARSLYHHGIDVDVATFCRVEPQVWSRAIRKFYRVPDPDHAPEQFEEAIAELIRDHHYDMLIPGNDVGLTAIVEHYDAFRSLVHVACPPPAVVERVLNKEITLEMARACGVCTPRSVVLSNSSELAAAGRIVGYPFILKPCEKKRVDEFKSRLIENEKALVRMFPSAHEFSTTMLAQEICSGVGLGVEVLMHKGEAVALFQHRRMKEVPPRGGLTVISYSDPLDPAIVQPAIELLKALEWDGPAMVEFKVNAATGVPTFLEVNGRYWGTIALSLLGGMDFPFYHWQLVHNQVPEIPSKYTVGAQTRWTAGWLTRYHDLLIDARKPGPAREMLLRDLHTMGDDFRPPVRDALFSSADPIPGFVEFWHTAVRLIRSDFRRAIRAFKHRERKHDSNLTRIEVPMQKFEEPVKR